VSELTAEAEVRLPISLPMVADYGPHRIVFA